LPRPARGRQPFDLRGELATILGDGTRRYLPGDPSAGYEQAGTWYSALTDQLGSPHSTVSQSGVQSAITRWDPFGAVRPGSSVTGGIGFAGEWRDPAGLIDLRARAYDPATGRFTSRDPFGGLGVAPQTANRYSYALNGPYRYADPSGRFVNAVVANAPLLLSIAISSTPIVGDAYSALTGLIGYDPIAGISLSSEERALALASAAVIGGGFHLLSRVGDKVADGAKAIANRTADAFTQSRLGGRVLGLGNVVGGIRVGDGLGIPATRGADIWSPTHREL
jgi:RHS repeat-associated protein